MPKGPLPLIALAGLTLALTACSVGLNRVAQFIAVCSRSKSVYMGTSRHPRCSPLCTRWALKWRGDGQLIGQCLRATKYDKLSGPGLTVERVA
jgi:hypothetical protein